MLDAYALIFLLLTFLREHRLPHIEGQVINCEIDVHDGVQLFLGGDQVKGRIVELPKLQVSDTCQLVSCFCHILSSCRNVVLCLTLLRSLGDVS